MRKTIVIALFLSILLTSCTSSSKSKEIDINEIKDSLYLEFYKEKLVVEIGQPFNYEDAIKHSNGTVTPIQDVNQSFSSPGEYQFTFLVESEEYPEASKIIEVQVVVVESVVKDFNPKFEGIKEEYIFEQGTLINLYKGVNVRDYHGDIIPFEVVGEWNNSVIGEYVVTYRAIDIEGNETIIDIILQIIPSDNKDNEEEIIQIISNDPILCLGAQDPTKECDWIPRSSDATKTNLFLFVDYKEAFQACTAAGNEYVSRFKEPGYKGQYRCIGLKNNINEEVGYELWKYKISTTNSEKDE